MIEINANETFLPGWFVDRDCLMQLLKFKATYSYNQGKNSTVGSEGRMQQEVDVMRSMFTDSYLSWHYWQ